MGRFLTPARVCLLTLVRTYQAGHTSSESVLPVLDFIAQQIVVAPEHTQQTLTERNDLASSDIDFVAEQLRQWPSRHPGQSMYDVLLDAIWTLRSLDSLHALVDEDDPETLAVGAQSLTPASPLGRFIRRCYVEFSRLQFDDSKALWNAFAAYRAPTYDEWERKNPSAAAENEEARDHCSVPVVIQGQLGSITEKEKVEASTVDVDAILGFAIQRLQKLGNRVPDEVKARLEQWVGDQADSSTRSLHFFMAFFEHWRSGQYTMALESLHRYFDYSLMARSGGTDNMKVYYQYALLHLSVLHADFECWEESVDAMSECIATARENQDTACLNFALSWLLYLRHAHPEKGKSSFGAIAGVVDSGTGEHEEIAFLQQKAREGKHWMLLSSTLLEDAKVQMYRGGTATNRALEQVLQAMHLNMQHDLRSLAPAAMLFQGASFDRLGQAHLANCYYELPAAIHFLHCPLNDRVRSVCRIAYNLAQNGLFSRALDILDRLGSLVPGILKLEQRTKAFAALVQLRRYLHRDDMNAFTYYLTQLRPLRSGSDPEIAFEISLLEIEALIKQHRLEDALKKVGERLQETDEQGTDLAQRLHFLILKSRIFAIGGQASKGFSVALRATSTAESCLLLPVLLDGLAVLSRILIELKEFQAATDILEAALPHAIGTNCIELTARMYVAMGEACVAFAGFECEPGSNEQAHSMRKAQTLIEQGRIAYERTEDLRGMLDCLVMKSKIAIWSGDESSAAQADEMYMQLLNDK